MNISLRFNLTVLVLPTWVAYSLLLGLKPLASDVSFSRLGHVPSAELGVEYPRKRVVAIIDILYVFSSPR